MGWGPKAPDMTAANEATRQGMEINREQWDTFRSDMWPMIVRQMQLQEELGRGAYDMAREQQDFQLGAARRFDQRYWDRQVPLEDSLIDEAMNFDTDAERERLAGEARGDVEQAFGDVRAQMRRDVGRYGLNPSDPAYMMAQKRMSSDQALATAHAMNKTREAAKQMGWAKRMDAAALGRGLPGFSGEASRTALGWQGAGQAGLNSGMQGVIGGVGAWNQTAGGASSGFQNAAQNYRANAIESARNPSFDAMMGLISGGMRTAGSIYGR